jgi:tRNA G18 (ribose-2'-O)-methylase SpoU
MKKAQATKKEVVVILDNIRSVFNVGSMFRTSDAVGVSKLYLCGTTPAPLDRFNRPRPDLAKVALGAEKNVPWEYVSDTKKIVKKLKKGGYFVVAIEQDKNSVDYKKISKKFPLAVVMGNEVDGVDKKILKEVDEIAEIPMRGDKESLNVGVAYGIAIYNIL